MTSVKGMDPDEASSVALYLTPEVGINQVGESAKLINSRSWKYLIDFMLDMIRALEGGTKEIPTPPASSFLKIRKAAWKVYQLQYLEVQVGVQVELPVTTQPNILLQCQPSSQPVCQVKHQQKILNMCQNNFQVPSQKNVNWILKRKYRSFSHHHAKW